MQKSCDSGHMRACWNIGLLYSNGSGVKRDKNKSLRFYKIACDGGYKKGCDSYEIFTDIYSQ